MTISRRHVCVFAQLKGRRVAVKLLKIRCWAANNTNLLGHTHRRSI
jgi:hypothetical protein